MKKNSLVLICILSMLYTISGCSKSEKNGNFPIIEAEESQTAQPEIIITESPEESEEPEYIPHYNELTSLENKIVKY
ncbi:MAG: hypothetical protein FWG33_03375 [Oscillospiraceae bacterium]|nr:hypothetical protein [Oscillospiraceae bacterium]